MGVPINNVTRRVVYAASGTGPYNFTFEILAAGDIAVYRDNTLLTITTDYTVTINTNGTGFVTLTATPTGATQIAIVGNRTIQRTTDFVTGGDFFANTLNDELDQQTIFNQQNAEGLNRALQAPQTDPTTINMTLPAKASRANKTLSFDADGNPTPGVSAADVANAVTYATNAANSATAAAASASAAASSASSASSSASTATTQASNASTSASNASTSATNASNSASAAATSETNAASSASAASTSASNASTSASNAASSASAASTSASNASTSATNAANSATAAATSETNAAASAASAAAALDSFDDRYLGAKTADPTVDNDGNALVTGALYYRTTTPVGMKVYDGAQWIEASAAQQSLLVTYEYVATAGQTTFSGTDANGATLSYVANSISVSLNGVTLRPGDDYTATNGTSVVLNVAAALNDDLMVIAFAVFNVANAVAKTGDTMTGALNLQANLVFDGNARRITGDFSNATIANRVLFQTSTANSNSSLGVIPNGTAQQGNIRLYNNSDPTNASILEALSGGGGEVSVRSGITGTGTYLPMTFWTNGSETARLSATAKTLILSGGDTTANGTGITFPATQSASSNANTLDDYEEGTWTGTLKGVTTNPTTPVTATGKYTKIGRQVTIAIYFNGVTTTGASGLAFVDGLPFSEDGTRAIATVGTFLFDLNTGTSVFGDFSGAAVYLQASKDDASWVDVLHNPGTFRYLRITGTYFVS
jgi:hypothetical protein